MTCKRLASGRKSGRDAGMRHWIAILFACWLPLAASALEYGMTREQVIKELGKPTSDLVRGDRRLLTYPKNVRIELEGDRVTVVKGLEVVDGAFRVPPTGAPAGAPAAAVAPVETPEAKAEREAREMQEAAEREAQAKAEAEMQKQINEEHAKSMAEMEKAIGQLESIHEGKVDAPPPPSFSLLAFLVELVIKWLMMLAALKLTCKFWGYDVFWRSLLITAAVDTAVRTVVYLIGTHLLGMISLFYADEAIAAIAMVLVLKKVSINQSTAFAAQITLTSKVFSVVVGSLLVTVALRVLH